MKTRKKGQRHPCKLCDKTYCSKRAVDNHNNYYHKGLKLYECPHCEKSYSDRTPRRLHIENEHNGKNKGKFLCNKCDKSYNLERKLKEHRRKFHEMEKIKCDYCNKMVLNKYSMKKHIDGHLAKEEGIYKCSKCPYNFPNNRVLHKHLETHDKDRQRTFNCEVCKKDYFTKLALTLHTKYKHLDTKYECKLCNYTHKGMCICKKQNLTVQFVKQSLTINIVLRITWSLMGLGSIRIVRCASRNSNQPQN